MSAELNSKRCVLLIVTGMTPQIITETLYALKTERGIVPDEVHVVTTNSGAACVRRSLLEDGFGRWAQLLEALKPEKAVAFDAASIHVIRSDDGRRLDDIRTPEDNTWAADFITECVRGFCARPNVRLLVSLAGGRKSMGFYAGYALSLYGRQTDALYHVLVSSPYENQPEFFHPLQTDPAFLEVDGQMLAARDAQVMLADIPFVRMGNDPSSKKGSYMAAVLEAQSHQPTPASLVIDEKNRTIAASGTTLKLPPLLFAVYLWLSIRVREGRALCRPGADVFAEEFLGIYRRVLGPDAPDYEHACRALSRDEDFLPYFQEKRSLINRRLRGRLGDAAAPYLIASHVKRLNTRYGLSIPAEAISWI